MKKILLITCLSIATMFGATNELLNPKNQDIVIDIGYKNPKAEYNPNVVKEWVESNALTKTVEKLIVSKGRILSEKADCETDFLGREGCPIQEQSCAANIQTDPGIAIKIDKTLTQPKIRKVLENVSISSNSSASASGGSKTFKKDYKKGPVSFSVWTEDLGYYIYFTSINTGNVIWASPYTIGARDGDDVINYYSQIVSFSEDVTIHLTVVEGGKAGSSNMGYSVNGTIIDSNYSCPDTFVEADSINSSEGVCKKDYSYYNYKCKTDTNTYNKPWLGPVIDSGGDCNGQCGPNGCECNEPIPPTKNCVRDTYKCPTNENQLCVITTDNKESVNNILDGYIYENGTGIKQNKSILIGKSCLGGKTWNKNRDICESELSYSCKDNTYVYDETLKECVKDMECEGIVNARGMCESKANYECYTGYKYDETDLRCERFPICDRGEYSLKNDLCEEEANNGMCSAEYSWVENRFRCEKPLRTASPECPGEGLIYKTDTKHCEGFADLYNWQQKGSPSSGRWTYNSAQRELIQSINGQPTFYVSQAVYPASILEGRFMIENDGDDDWAGIVFGWMSDYSFYAFDWKQGNQGAARKGLRLMRINSTGGDAFGSWGDPNNNANHSILASNYGYPGWSYGTWYDMKIQFTEGKIEAFLNGTKVLTFEDPNLEIPVAKLGFLNVSQSSVHYKDFKITTTPICQAGYDYDEVTNLCYESVLNADRNLKVSYKEPNCPSGAWDQIEKKCKFNATCTDSGLIDNNDDRCVTNVVASCPTDKNYVCQAGSFYDQALKSCKKIPECTLGSNFNYLTNKCEVTPNCDTGFTFNLTSKKCEKELDMINLSCNIGEIFVNDINVDKCKIEKNKSYIDPINAGTTCPNEYIKEGSEGFIICYKLDNCLNGYTESANINYCERVLTCPNGYTIDNNKNICYK